MSTFEIVKVDEVEDLAKYLDVLECHADARTVRRMAAELAAIKEEVKILTAENELLEDRVSELEVREVDAIANKICEHLPEDYEIRFCMEKDAGWVELHCPDSGNDRHDFECSIYSQLLCALEVAGELNKQPGGEV